MKRKIICLAICVVCLLAALASCGDVECDAHVDADKNSACDNCGIPVITVIEKVPTEEEIVETVVSAIPENATLGSVMLIEGPKGEYAPTFQNATKLEGEVDEEINGLLVIEYYEQTAGKDTTENITDDKYSVTYKLYNPVTGKDVVAPITFADITQELIYENHLNTVRFSEVTASNVNSSETETVLIKVEITEWEKDEYDDWSSETNEAYYTFTGVEIANSKSDNVNYDNNDYNDVAPYSFSVQYVKEDILYVVVSGEKYAIDYELGTVIYKAPEDTFIERPAFDYETESYGYIRNGGNVYIYDLTKWIECVYAYEIPAGANVFYLTNGNILIQKQIAVHSAAKNYDYTDGMSKYDVDYAIFDVATKTATEIEFGYYIDSVVTVTAEDGYAAGVKNIVNAHAISNKNLGKALKLYTDDALTIIAEDNAIIPEFGLVNNLKPVADGVVLGNLVYGEGSSVRVLYDANGAEIAKLPNTAVVRENYILINGKYYDFTMKLIFDPKADEENIYTAYYTANDYIIFKKGDDFYYWNASKTAPTLIVDATTEDEVTPVVTQVLVAYNADYYVVKTTTTATDADPVVVYKAYNANGALIYEGEYNVQSIHEYYVGEDSYWALVLDDENESVYIAK